MTNSSAAAVEGLTGTTVEKWIEASFLKHAQTALEQYESGCKREDVWDEAKRYADLNGSRTGRPMKWKMWSSPTAQTGETPTEGVLLVYPGERAMVPELELGFSYSWDVFRPYVESLNKTTEPEEEVRQSQ
ncbi:hypothetical protein IAT38_002476 [Cryptococcus sp. DSM 104549]